MKITRIDIVRRAEVKALPAVDVALWVLAGQSAGEPVHRLMGGPARERAHVYNTCASPATSVVSSDS